MNNQLKKGVLDLIILGIIYKEEIHGYGIVQIINEHLNVKESSIYIILTRLEQNNYLVHRLDYNKNRKVKFYQITNDGIKYLEDLISSWDEINVLVDQTKGIIDSKK